MQNHIPGRIERWHMCETKLIELQIKQESLRAGYEKSRAELHYYAGTRPAVAAQ